MQKKILVLIGVFLLIINIAVATVTFSKVEYQRKYDNLLNKAATYTTISSVDRAFYQQTIKDLLNSLEKLMNDPNIPDDIKRKVLNSINDSYRSMEQALNNPNIPTAQKIAGIKATLQAMKTGVVDQQNLKNIAAGNTIMTNKNFSPAQNSNSCAVGQNIEGMCVYALPSYNVSLDIAKNSCRNYGMSFATSDQIKTLSKYAEIIYNGYPGEAGSIFPSGSVSGFNNYGKYYTVLCVNDANNTAITNKNFSPAQSSNSCAVGQNIEGMCVYALPSYNVSLDIAKNSCRNYGMSFATSDQIKTLSKYAEIIYNGYPGEAGSIFPSGSVSGFNNYGKYYTVLCVNNAGNTATTNKNFSPVQKQISCDVGQNIEGMCVYVLPSYNVSLEVAKNSCKNYGMSFATSDQIKILSRYSDIIYDGHYGESGSIFTSGSVSGFNNYGKYYAVLCVK